MNDYLFFSLLLVIICSASAANVPPPLYEEEESFDGANLTFSPRPLTLFGGMPITPLRREITGEWLAFASLPRHAPEVSGTIFGYSTSELPPSNSQYRPSFSNRPPSFSQYASSSHSRREIAMSVPALVRESDETIRLRLAEQKRAQLRNMINYGSVHQILHFMQDLDDKFTPAEALLVVKRINLERGHPIWSDLYDYFPLDSRFRTLATAALETIPELAKSVSKVLSQDSTFMKKYKFRNAEQIFKYCGF